MYKDLAKAPKIALIGKTGVGKSSNINALFGTNLEVGHFKACTQVEKGLIVKTEKGDLLFYDMPGLGEDIDIDKEHIKTYNKILPECDIIVWLIAADSRDMAYDQLMLKDILRDNSKKLVVCVNKVDKMHHDDWIEKANIPSRAQMENITKRIIDINQKLSKVIQGLRSEQILYYSAIKSYRLEELFASLLDACEDNKAWVLQSRMNISKYEELIHSEILEKLNHTKPK